VRKKGYGEKHWNKRDKEEVYMTIHEKTIEWKASKRKKTGENHLDRRSVRNKN